MKFNTHKKDVRQEFVDKYNLISYQQLHSAPKGGSRHHRS